MFENLMKPCVFFFHLQKKKEKIWW